MLLRPIVQVNLRLIWGLFPWWVMHHLTSLKILPLQYLAMPANESSPSHSATRRHAHKFIIDTMVREAACHHHMSELQHKQNHAWEVSPLIGSLLEGIVLMAHTQMLEGGLKPASTEWSWADAGTVQHVAVQCTRVSTNCRMLQRKLSFKQQCLNPVNLQ